ncbi:hypothetical protein [Anaerobacillus alkalidiazotrophicus]|uniref:hypothetical protein n=1 Tax=Anaerobacillus alkalidiazotrophicus TaxID=472963 RepID=UPI001113F4BD|nr:hypothetical protein [Anaerobacillus alkalidiazotrophicus]
MHCYLLVIIYLIINVQTDEFSLINKFKVEDEQKRRMERTERYCSRIITVISGKENIVRFERSLAL